jgi:hypothetical protein
MCFADNISEVCKYVGYACMYICMCVRVYTYALKDQSRNPIIILINPNTCVIPAVSKLITVYYKFIVQT